MIQLITGKRCFPLDDFNNCSSVKDVLETFSLVKLSFELASWEFELDCMQLCWGSVNV